MMQINTVLFCNLADFHKGPTEVNFLWRKWLPETQEFSRDPMDQRREQPVPIPLDDDLCVMKRHASTLTIKVHREELNLEPAHIYKLVFVG